MLTYKGFHHISLTVSNIGRAKEFYSNILCLEELTRPPFDFEGAWYKIGDQQIHLIVADHLPLTKKIDSKRPHFALRVEDYEKTLEWLQASNIDFVENRYSKSGFAQIFCCDPDGNVIELHVDQTDLTK